MVLAGLNRVAVGVWVQLGVLGVVQDSGADLPDYFVTHTELLGESKNRPIFFSVGQSQVERKKLGPRIDGSNQELELL